MKSTKILIAAACSLFLSTAAFAQTSPTGGTTTGSMSGSVNTQPQRGSGINKDGMVTPSNGTNTNMNNGSMNGSTDRKSKMNGRKDMKKTKTSTTSGSTGTM